MKTNRNLFFIVFSLVLIAIVATFVFFFYPRYVDTAIKYNQAMQKEQDGDTLGAAMLYDRISNYRDSRIKARQAWLKLGDERIESGDPVFAINCYKNAGADDERIKTLYDLLFECGKQAYENADNAAEVYFDSIDSDAYTEMMDDVRISAAETLAYAEEFEKAKAVFNFCSFDAADKMTDVWFEVGKYFLNNNKIGDAYSCFMEAKRICSDEKLTSLLEDINTIWNDSMTEDFLSNDTAKADEFEKYSSMFEKQSVLKKRNRLRYTQACDAYEQGDYATVLRLLSSIDEDYENTEQMLGEISQKLKNMPAAGGIELGALLNLDGSVTLLGKGWKIDAVNWANIKNIAVGKEGFILGVRNNGSVVAAGKSSYNRTNVDKWKNVTAVACGKYHSLGLTADGTVLATGWNYYGQTMTNQWSNVIAVACSENTSYGLTKNGRVYAAGDDSMGQRAVSAWDDIAKLAAGSQHVVGVKNDGTVIATGNNSKGQCNVTSWRNVVDVAAGDNHTVALLANGTLVAIGDNTFGQCDVSEFENVVAVAAGNGFTIIVFENGDYTVIGDLDVNE